MNSSSRFEISQQIHKSQYSMRSAHSHGYYELYYLMDGECNFFIHDNVYRLTKGTIVFIPANILHKTTYLNQCTHQRIYIEFTLDYVSDVIESIGLQQFKDNLYCKFFNIPPNFIKPINHLYENMLNEKEHPGKFSDCEIKLYFQQLILLLISQFHTSILGSSDAAVSSVEVVDNSIQQAMNYICAHYTEPVCLNDIAKMLHLNASYFSKKFKTVNGFGLNEYLNTVRINHAERLLLETKKTITEIAFECGYDNSNYFGDAFKRLDGISPSEFRKIKGNVKD